MIWFQVDQHRGPLGPWDSVLGLHRSHPETTSLPPTDGAGFLATICWLGEVTLARDNRELSWSFEEPHSTTGGESPWEYRYTRGSSVEARWAVGPFWTSPGAWSAPERPMKGQAQIQQNAGFYFYWLFHLKYQEQGFTNQVLTSLELIILWNNCKQVQNTATGEMIPNT